MLPVSVRQTLVGHGRTRTLKNLISNIQNHAEGFPKIKNDYKTYGPEDSERCDIKPFKIRTVKGVILTSSQRCDVLVVYKQVSMQFDEEGNIIIPTDQPMVHTISCDEKPGIQAIATTSEDLRPKDETAAYTDLRI